MNLWRYNEQLKKINKFTIKRQLGYINKGSKSLKNVSRVILYTDSVEFNRLLSDAFVIKGVPSKSVVRVKDMENCLKALSRPGLSYLVISNKVGLFTVNKILDSITETGLNLSKPTMLITDVENSTLSTLAVEYGVTETYIGGPDKERVRSSVSRLVDDTPLSNELNKEQKKYRTSYLSIILGALKVFEAALRDTKGDSEKLRFNAAELYIQIKDTAKARRVLEPLESLGANNKAKLYYLLARVAMLDGNSPEAYEYFEMCHFLNPANLVQLVNIGNNYIKMGDNQSAKEVFEDVMSIDEASYEAKAGLGTCELIAGNLEDGMKLLSSTINVREKCSYFNTAAIFNVRTKSFDRALDLYKNALKIAAPDPSLVASICFNIGLLYYKTNNPEQSLKYFEKVLEYKESHENAQYNIDVLRKYISGESNELNLVSSNEVDSSHAVDFEDDAILDNLLESIDDEIDVDDYVA